MPDPYLAKFGPGSTGQTDLARATQGSASQASVSVLNDGVLVEGVAFTAATDAVVTHNLRRVPRGYIVVSVTFDTTTPGLFTQSGADDYSITLQTDQACTASFWVF